MREYVLQVKKLSVGYGERRVLSDVEFGITTGEFVGITVWNGSGYSTLLKSIRGLLPKLGGEVLYYDRPLETYGERALARRVAYLQQQVEIGFGYTAQDIVMAGRYPYMQWWQRESEADRRLALDCMAYTGTRELAAKPVTEVSGGQKQRVLLAKVLAQQTPLLFLDEPTTGLDLVYQEEIFRFAQALAARGKTILMVVHELNLAARYCGRVLLVGEGRILADDVPANVFTEALLSRAYCADIEVGRNPLNNNLEISSRVSEATVSQEERLLDKIC